MGLDRGFQTTKRPRKVMANAKLASPHGRLRAVKAIVADVVGLTPLDRRLVEMLRVGKEKRALKLAKKRLGNITYAKKRRARMRTTSACPPRRSNLPFPMLPLSLAT